MKRDTLDIEKLGRYDIIRILGRGAMGVVYEARDPNLDRRVAIKTVKIAGLSDESAAEYEMRFRTEARSAGRLQHPNIVSVYDADRDDTTPFLVMEFVAGLDLKHHLDSGARYTLEQTVRMMRDLLSALDYAHQRKIVHRDIKPANLLIEPSGRLKLTDFGVARIQDSGDVTHTQGGMVGTLKYMSPEQAQGMTVDASSDIFSAGIVLYQLLTDRRPFDGASYFQILTQITQVEPAAPSSINGKLPGALDAVVARALAKDKAKRFATAADFSAALQAAAKCASDPTITPSANPFKPLAMADVAERTGGTAASASNGTGSTITQELELVYWKDIKDSSEAEDLEIFLAKFPEGVYVDLAKRRLKKLHDQFVAQGATPHYESTVAASAAAAHAAPPWPAQLAVEPVADSVSNQETAAALAGPAQVTPTHRAKRSKTPWFAAGGAAILVAVAALFMGQSQPKTTDFAAAVPLPAASAAPGSTSPAAAGAPGKPELASPEAVVLALPNGTASMPVLTKTSANSLSQDSAKVTALQRNAASSPKTAGSATKPSLAGARNPDQTVTERTNSVNESMAQRKPAADTTAPKSASKASPRDACENRLLLGFQICMRDQCVKPEFQAHPICVERHEMEERRRGFNNAR